MIDLKHLSPEPWDYGIYDDDVLSRPPYCVFAQDLERLVADCTARPSDPPEVVAANAMFIAIARNAFGVMMRRGWGVVHRSSGWFVAVPDEGFPNEITFRKMRFPDPFTALVESDKWYRENVESNPSAEWKPPAKREKDTDEQEAWLTDPLGPSEHPDDLR